MSGQQTLRTAALVLTIGAASWFVVSWLRQPGPEDAGYFTVDEVTRSPYGVLKWIAGGEADRSNRLVGKVVDWKLQVLGETSGVYQCSDSSGSSVSVILKEPNPPPSGVQLRFHGTIKEATAAGISLNEVTWKTLDVP
jgi:hypothetical protein